MGAAIRRPGNKFVFRPHRAMPARVEEEPVHVARMVMGASYSTVPPVTRSFSATATSLRAGSGAGQGGHLLTPKEDGARRF